MRHVERNARLARNRIILALRQAGHTYEDIGNALVQHGFSRMSKQGIKEVVRRRRPDLMGSRRAYRDNA